MHRAKPGYPHPWQADVAEEMERLNVNDVDLAYYLGISRQRIWQLLRRRFADEAESSTQCKRLQSALAWCSEHRPQGRIRCGDIINDCEVVARLHRGTWNMRCRTCGREFRTYGQYIRNGRAHCAHCTGFVREDLTGQTFGGWEVLGLAYTAPQAAWRCRCSCGNVVTVTQSNLIEGRTLGCRLCLAKRRGSKPQARTVLVPIYKGHDEPIVRL